MQALQGSNLAGTAANTMTAAASGSLPVTVTPQVTAMQNYLKQYQAAGAANLMEQFGVKGLRSSSDMDKAAAQYEASSAADMGNILAQYQQQQQGQQIQAAEAGLGMVQPAAMQTYAPKALVTGPSPLQSVFSGIGAAGSLFAGLGALG